MLLYGRKGKQIINTLKRAGDALGVGYVLQFEPANGADMGDDQLLKQCRALARVAQPRATIFMFDRDKPDIVSKVEENAGEFKFWGNNVYSFAIPVPAYRTPDVDVCIELYYTDDEIRTNDTAGRRLFLLTEFNPASGRHLSDLQLSVGNKGKLSAGSSNAVRIIDLRSMMLSTIMLHCQSLSLREMSRVAEEGLATSISVSF